jgi:hypothetical protein
MTMTVNGFTEAELDRQRLAQGNPTAGAIATLQTVADRLRSAVSVSDAEQQVISAQASLGARGGSNGTGTPGDVVRAAKMAEFRSSDAARIPGLVRDERAAAVDAARARVNELLGGMVQDGDAAQEIRNSRTLDQVRTRLGDSANVAQALAELERHKGNRSHLGLVAEELRSRYQDHGDLIDQHLVRIDPELAAAQTALRNEERDFQVVTTAAAAVQKGIETGNAPSTTFFEHLASAVSRP